jgi:putative ABC transport system substrate-binding protein
MNRRDVQILLSGAAIGWPLAGARSEQKKLPRIGYLSLAPGVSPRSKALQEGLRDRGYVDGQNIILEYRWADGDLDRLRAAAADLVRLQVDVIVTGGPAATSVARKATTVIPIVMAVDYDPVGAGFVQTLSRPGGNITGLSILNPELSAKRLELLKEAVPAVSFIAVLWDPAEPNAEAYLRESRTAAPNLGVELLPLQIRSPGDIKDAFQAAKKAGSNGLTVLTDPITLYHRAELASLAADYRLPAIYSERLFVEAGGLMSYGASDRDLHRLAAGYVYKILQGAKPADLPVEQPTKFELVINVKTAIALNLVVPPLIMERADDIIE